MEITYHKSFVKELKRCPAHTQNAVKEIIQKLLAASSLQNSGVDYVLMQHPSKEYYRIRTGNYRIGIKYIHPSVIIITILSRGDIYKHFP